MHAPLPTSNVIQAPSGVDYRALYFRVRERAWLIGLCFLAAALISATILVRSPRIYAASTVLLVEQEQEKVVDIQRVQAAEYQSLEALKTVEQTLQNKSLIERVVDSSNLTQDSRIALDAKGHPMTREQLIAKLQAEVDVHLRRTTRLIDITVENTNPEVAAMVANSLVNEFLRQDYEETADALHAANDFLEKQAQEIKTKLDGAENALQAYKEQAQFVSSSNSQDTVTQGLDELGQKTTEAKSARIAAETDYQEVKALGGNVDDLLASSAATDSADIKDIRASLAKAESDFTEGKLHYRWKHPKYIQMQSEVAQWQRALTQAALALPQKAQAAYLNAKAAEQALDDALIAQQTAALEMNKKAIRFDELSRDVESDRALYQTVLNRIKENTVIKDLKTSNIRVIQKAEVPDYPVKPDGMKIVLAGLFGAILSSVVLVYFFECLDQSLKTVTQTEDCLGLPVLSAIPRFEEEGPKGASGKLEAFRTLRANLSMLGRQADRKVFLFTSSLPGEGKTFCSINYALSLAQQGLRTLVIDSDLRRPMIERVLNEGHERQAGLTDYLTTHKKFSGIIHATTTDNLFYIPGGTTAPNPVELLANSGFEGLIREALGHFDRIVVDSAPIHVVSDTLLILDGIQTVCLVLRANATPRHSALRTIQILQQAGAPLGGIVLNLMPRLGNNGYYYDFNYRAQYAESAS